ncbi:MAG: type II toxin-antitoxin system ParD family antitoxin [Deltaproteobacteria bacterium]|nr:type II toxin-antitoxin system ParD family antitoxin [Deltaproteobacteria bacterium]
MADSSSTALNISLPVALKRFVEAQSARGGYTSSSEYIRELIREARRKSARSSELETLLLAGAESGPCIEADDAYWSAKEKGLMSRWRDLEE